MVSLQRTARLVSGTPTRKKLACWTGPEGRAGSWQRRDATNRSHIVSGGKTVWRTVVWSEGDDTGQTRGRRLNGKAHSLPTRFGLQARIGGNALGSRPSLVSVPMQPTRDLINLSRIPRNQQETKATRLMRKTGDQCRVVIVVVERTLRKARREHRSQGEGPQGISFRTTGVRRNETSCETHG